MLFERSQNAMLVRVDVALQEVGAVLVAAQRAAMDNNFVCAVMGRIGVGSLLVGFAPIAVDPPAAMQYVNAVSFLRGAVPRDGSAIVVRCPVGLITKQQDKSVVGHIELIGATAPKELHFKLRLPAR